MAKTESDFAAWHRHFADLKAYDLASQTPEQQLSTRVLTWFIESQLQGERFRFHDYPVNQLFGVQSQTPDFLISQHLIADRRGADDYLARLDEVGRKFDQVLEGLTLREQRGVVPPRFVIERVLTEMRGFSGGAATENPLYKNFATKVEALADVAPADRQALLARCAQAIDGGVVPAYRKLIAFFEAQMIEETFFIPYRDSRFLNRIHESCRVLEESFEDEGTRLRVLAPEGLIAELKGQLKLSE